METETDPRIRQIWELHLSMELEHLRLVCDAMKQIDGIDAADIFPKGGVSEPMTFEPNKQYVRDVLARTAEWTAWDSEFVPIGDLPQDHRFFEMQRIVNRGGVPSEQVIEKHRDKFGGEYRFSTEGEHPVAALRDSGTEEQTTYAKATERAMETA